MILRLRRGFDELGDDVRRRRHVGITHAEIDHVFTHFSLTLRVFRAEGMMEAEWTTREGLGALPSLFLKAARKGLA